MFGLMLCAYLREQVAIGDEIEREEHAASWANARPLRMRMIHRTGRHYKKVGTPARDKVRGG